MRRMGLLHEFCWPNGNACEWKVSIARFHHKDISMFRHKKSTKRNLNKHIASFIWRDILLQSISARNPFALFFRKCNSANTSTQLCPDKCTSHLERIAKQQKTKWIEARFEIEITIGCNELSLATESCRINCSKLAFSHQIPHVKLLTSDIVIWVNNSYNYPLKWTHSNTTACYLQRFSCHL